MKDDKLIKSLVDDLEPVKPLKAPHIRFMIWSIFAMAIVLTATFFKGPMRESVSIELENIKFLLLTIATFIPFISAGIGAFYLLIPGNSVKKGLFIGFAPGILYLLLTLQNTFSPFFSPSMMGKRPHCSAETIVYTLISAAIFWFFAKKSAPLAKKPVAILIGWASASLPLGLMQMACMYMPQHNITHHLLPAVATVTLVALILPRMLNWEKSPKN